MDPPDTPLHLLLGERDALVRESLVLLLRHFPGVGVVVGVRDVAEARAAIEHGSFQVAVLNWDLPGGSLKLAQRLIDQPAGCAVIVYSLPDDDTVVAATIDAGVRGLFDATLDLETFVDALPDVLDGKIRLSQRLFEGVVQSHARLVAASSRIGNGQSLLTPRESHVLGLVATGLSNRAMAEQLGLSVHTIRAHLRNASAKLGASNRVQAVAEALRRGVLVHGASASPQPPAVPGF